MNEKEFVFLQQKVRDFYRQGVPVPPALPQREMGFGWKKKIDYRHKAFLGQRDLEAFVRQESPLFASYSTAYYRFPEKQPMDQKEYEGADLVFDLDAPVGTHEHQPTLCRLCLSDIHQQALRLMAILENDFSFQSQLVFSGQKGFHIHVRSESVRDLSKNARRQLAEYVAADGIKAETLFAQEAIPMEGRVPAKTTIGPSDQSAGWPRKILAMAQKAVRAKDGQALKRYGFNKKGIATAKENPDAILSALSAGRWGAYCPKPNADALIADAVACDEFAVAHVEAAPLAAAPSEVRLRVLVRLLKA
ncbi:MAG: DNA primase small subunit domain-containing protein, partial [Candidatus Micrarchaeota archaeon]|nr:DNA primase small subunit domain-containing protein [Candidatus Micrarchaeota archaeon]